MSIAIPESIMLQARVSESELLREIAILLFRQERITLGSAAQVAAMPQPEFQMLLDSRGIAAHYTDTDLEHNVETLQTLGYRLAPALIERARRLAGVCVPSP